MLKTGWIKLHRSLTEWEWYDDVNTRAVFVHLLLTVSIRPQKWHGIEVPRGGRIVSFIRLAEETFLTIPKVRTAIEHLEKTGEIARSSHGKFTVITIKNFDRYQGDDMEIAGCSQEDRTEFAGSSQQYKKEKKEKKEKKDEKCVCPQEAHHTQEAAFPDANRILDMTREQGLSWDMQEAERFLAYNRDKGRTNGWEYAIWRWEEHRRAEHPSNRTSGTEGMTQAEIDTMNDYLSLVNTFGR